MTTIALWPQAESFTGSALLGKPVWQRTRDAALAVKPRQVVWVGRAAPDGSGLHALSPKKLEHEQDTIVLLPAELACVTPGALKRLLKGISLRPRGLFPSGGGSPRALAASAADLKVTGPRSFDVYARKLKPEAVFAEGDDELRLIDSARAWSEAHRTLRGRKVERLIKRGVLIPDPESVYVDPEVSVARGAILHPWVHIEGDSRIGKGAVVHSFTHVVDSTIGSDTTILDHCFIRDSRIGKSASIGPFAHLRPLSDVGDRARVGNFVELKKASLGKGAKAPHLSYVGDAEVGRDANLGAGTITCNYDGKHKNRTVVGDGAFIGSDVQLVAPVRVGKGAFVAAGSCIVEDVPANALALARSRQLVKRGWATKRRS